MIKLTRVTPEEVAWTLAQPVAGTASLSRLAGALRATGWEPFELALSDDGESVNFSLGRGDRHGHTASDREVALRILIRSFRRAGFCVGFTELAIDTFEGDFLTGSSLVGPLEHVCEHGPVRVRP